VIFELFVAFQALMQTLKMTVKNSIKTIWNYCCISVRARAVRKARSILDEHSPA